MAAPTATTSRSQHGDWICARSRSATLTLAKDNALGVVATVEVEVGVRLARVAVGAGWLQPRYGLRLQRNIMPLTRLSTERHWMRRMSGGTARPPFATLPWVEYAVQNTDISTTRKVLRNGISLGGLRDRV